MKNTLLLTALMITMATMYSCKKPYTCTCIGGIAFQQTTKEIKAINNKRAKQKCEGSNQPPNTPDVINCWLE